MKKRVLFAFLAAGLAAFACRPETGFIEDAIVPHYGLVEETVDTVGFYSCKDNSEGIIHYEITENGKYLARRLNKLGVEIFTVGVLGEIDFPESVKESYCGEFLPGEDVLTDNLCRSWSPEKTMATVKGKGMSAVGAIFDGCRLRDFFEYMDRHGMSMKRVHLSEDKKNLLNEALRLRKEYDEGYGGLEVEDVTFTHEGRFFISLVEGQPYVGNWKWADKEDKKFNVEFSLNDEEHTKVVTDGYVAFNGEGCELTFDAAFTSKGKPLNAYIDLVCPLNNQVL